MIGSKKKNNKKEEKKSSEYLIEMKGIRTVFGEQIVHDSLDFKALSGEITVIVGPSGVGKTVLLRYMLGLEEPDAGEIYFHGINTLEMSKRERADYRGRLGVIFQSSALFDSFTVYDNVALPLREKTDLPEAEISDKVDEMLESVGMAGSGSKYPSQLSGGMQRRCALARALVTDPEIIFFDEPTTGLDPRTKYAIYNLLQETHEKIGYSAVMISHDIPRIFSFADNIAALHNGRIEDNINPRRPDKVSNPWLLSVIEHEKKQGSKQKI